MSADLVLDHVSKRFPGARSAALDTLSLTVGAQTCTAVLGPSGSGKSTLLRVIAGLETPDAGTVRIGGRDMGPIVAERRDVGMVFQRSLLFPHLTVRDNIAFADRVAGMSKSAARTRAEEYLAMVQLAGYGDRRVGELSGGQEQRVAIARALAAQPAVLLLDEPFSALDPALRNDMHDLLATIRRAVSPTIVLVTHDRDEAARVADRIAVMQDGALLHEGSVADAYRRPRTLQVARLMGGRNEIPGRVVGERHVSALGRLPLRSTVGEGDAVLLIRQEDIGLVDPAAPGASTSSRIDAVVTDIRRSGARTEVTVRTSDGTILHAEAPGTQPPIPGDAIGLDLPHAALHVVTG